MQTSGLSQAVHLEPYIIRKAVLRAIFVDICQIHFSEILNARHRLIWLSPAVRFLALAFYTSVSHSFFDAISTGDFFHNRPQQWGKSIFRFLLKVICCFRSFDLIKICNILPRAVFNLPFLAVARPGEPNN